MNVARRRRGVLLEDSAPALFRWNSDHAAAFLGPLDHPESMLRNALGARLTAHQPRRCPATP